ncbi:hypothetical protein [Magnetospirillum gryphiswaldense]|uniref:HPr kinase n=2 Tax=Magnetospirillum gryphiswaldense TaxID=55518 RepID=V6F029_MAGGM|nr:hypothetical protein [Magnetospirillum gryphiswaldense]AVM73185.1 hypothetical protein MSR1_06770 [Magnetospirillum gryphiswaldense MSR-1]AVM77088.1 hypothetical protein MSR1L_06770 [Magnetospirillum gryphiswaldense]CAM75264.1 conserved hypothetical protein [Magnetospirillum gryphiswaldense MSR-1]CDK97833.1 conserved protein of unknown function [Magnetospirillum gryphiswaldense MSR-1 v2]
MVFTDRLLCGWRVRSDLPLPDLLSWNGDDRDPDLHIRFANVPETLADAVPAGPLLQIAKDGTCRFALPRVAAYLVRQGREILVQPAPGATDTAVRTFLFGTVFGLLAHQRGLVPLHASSVRIGDTAVAFTGRSGTGKSTLAAAFLHHGYEVLADDVTVVDVTRPGCPMVLPAFPRLKLWQDALAALEIDTARLEAVRPELQKFALPIEQGFHSAPLPLAAVYHLETVLDPRHAALERLRGLKAVMALQGHVYRMTMLSRISAPIAVHVAATQLATRLGAHWRLARCHDHGDTEAIIAGIVARQAAS